MPQPSRISPELAALRLEISTHSIKAAFVPGLPALLSKLDSYLVTSDVRLAELERVVLELRNAATK